MKKRTEFDGLKISTWVLVISAVTLFIFSSVMWRRFVFLSDKRVFWGAIDKALSVEGVAVSIDDSSETVIRETTLTQDFSNDLSSESRTVFKDDTIDSIIRTVSTKTNDYLYYEKNQNTKNPKLSDFEGIWVDIGAPEQSESKTLSDNLTNGSLILIGNLTSSDRKRLLGTMRDDNLYTVQGVVRTEQKNGKEVRVYRVEINTVAYNKALKSYLSIIGLDQASAQVIVDDQGAPAPVVEVMIEPISRTIFASGYPELSSEGAREYTKWDVRNDFELPTSFITSDELQKRLDTVYTQPQ